MTHKYGRGIKVSEATNKNKRIVRDGFSESKLRERKPNANVQIATNEPSVHTQYTMKVWGTSRKRKGRISESTGFLEIIENEINRIPNQKVKFWSKNGINGPNFPGCKKYAHSQVSI